MAIFMELFNKNEPEAGVKKIKLEINPPVAVEKNIHENIIGQEQAIKELAKLYVKIRSGIRTVRLGVIDSVFLAGPSGVGKTESVLTLAKMLMNTMPLENVSNSAEEESGKETKKQPIKQPIFTEEDALKKVIKIDGGNFQHGHEVAKVLGSPPGYLGHGETLGLLHPMVLSKHQINFKDLRGNARKVIFILLDEAEKAHEFLHHAFLTILDKGILTLGDNSVADLRDAVIFLTSNIGNAKAELLREKDLGFKPIKSTEKTLEASFNKEYKKLFRPEYRGRINKTIVFEHLRTEHLNKIIDLQLERIEEQFRVSGINLDLQISKEAKDIFIKRGYDLSEGARRLKKVLERYVLDQLILVNQNDLNGKTVVVDIDEEKQDGDIVFYLIDRQNRQKK
ncbi:MAG: ATP-dependent Clp protease ATP-binding subunit [Candidatus Yanofskybacteria bacterium]|nr:ATP-dependent Clp protease ATP-binding subunit [Candidatus Yanofskybacteria bacterium]